VVSSRQVMGSLPGGAWPGDGDNPEPQLQASLALGPAPQATGAFAPRHPTGAGQRPLPGNRGQVATVDQASIVVDPAQDMDARFGTSAHKA